MPAEGSEGHSLFAWRDGPFLSALKNGSWILLDELNLASQSVLEGLNACLDHRGEVFIPELNRTFKVDTRTTRIFACQNPLFQGSGRKGLPKSFLSRFTQVSIIPSLILQFSKLKTSSLSSSVSINLLKFHECFFKVFSSTFMASKNMLIPIKFETFSKEHSILHNTYLKLWIQN